MATLSDWSCRLAEAVAPDEAQLAPLMVEAFVAGGAARADLFTRPQNSELGGFGPATDVMVFPHVLSSLAIAAPLVSGLLAAAPKISDLLDIVKGGVDLHDAVERRKKATALPDDPYAPLKQTLTVLDRELAGLEIADDERDLICYRVLHALLTDPVDSQRALVALGEAGDRA